MKKKLKFKYEKKRIINFKDKWSKNEIIKIRWIQWVKGNWINWRIDLRMNQLIWMKNETNKSIFKEGRITKTMNQSEQKIQNEPKKVETK